MLDPTGQFNTQLDESLRNYVPIRVPQPVGANPGAEAIAGQFDMGVVKGQAVLVGDPDPVDAFDGCAQGPTELTVMSDFLLSDANYEEQPESSRYGAVTFDETTVAVPGGVDNVFAYNLLVNATAVHAAPTFANLVNSAILRVLDDGINVGASITVSNKPLPLTELQNNISSSSDAFSAATYIMIAFAFLPASYAIFVVRERETGAKHQQLISGVSLPAYWLATYLWDSVSYLIPSGLSILMFVAFGVEAYTTGESLTATALLFLLYGPAVAAQTYCFSYIFKSHSTAQNVVLLFNFLSGLALMITSFVLDALENTRELNQMLKHFFRLLPPFCLGNGLIQLSFCQDTGPEMGVQCATSFFGQGGVQLARPLDFDVAGLNILYLGCETVVYFGICLLIEVGLTFPAFAAIFDRVRDPGTTLDEVDEDVAAEAERVQSGTSTRSLVQMVLYASGLCALSCCSDNAANACGVPVPFWYCSSQSSQYVLSYWRLLCFLPWLQLTGQCLLSSRR